jgi:hypothetical protein
MKKKSPSNEHNIASILYSSISEGLDQDGEPAINQICFKQVETSAFEKYILPPFQGIRRTRIPKQILTD